MKNLKTIAILLATLLASSSCAELWKQGRAANGAVRFLVDADRVGARRLTATPPASELAAAAYVINAYGPNGEAFTIDTGAGDELSRSGLALGSWSFAAIAKNGSGTTLSSIAISDFPIAEGGNSVELHLIPLSGSGSLELSLSLPAEAAGRVSSVEGKLVAANSSETALSFSKSSSTVWDYPASTIASGEYSLFIEARDAFDKKIATATGAVWVFTNLETRDEIALTAGEINGPPEAPISLTASPATASNATIAWTDNSDTETGYDLERKEGGGEFAVIAAGLGPNSTSYVDATVHGKAAYSYRVRASNEFGYSAYAGPLDVSTPSAGKVPTPTFSSGSGTYSAPLSISLSSDSGASVEYSTDGTNWSQYSSAIPVSVSATLSARATRLGWDDSEVSTAAIAFAAAAPTYSIPAGSYGTSKSLALSCDSPGASVLYTIDGSDPALFGLVYSASAPIALSAVDTTVKAIARRSGWADSATTIARYRIPWETLLITGLPTQPLLHASVIDSSGILHIVYSCTMSDLRHLAINGAGYADEQVLPLRTVAAISCDVWLDDLALAADGNGGLHLAYREIYPNGYVGSNFSSTYSVKYMKCTGGAWSTPATILTTTVTESMYAAKRGSIFPALALTVSPDGSTAYFLTGNSGSGTIIYATWNGSAVGVTNNPGYYSGKVNMIGATSYYNTGVTIKLDASNNPSIFVQESAIGRLQQWNGGAWVSPAGIVVGQVGLGLPNYEPKCYYAGLADAALDPSVDQAPCVAYTSTDPGLGGASKLVYITKTVSGPWSWEIVGDSLSGYTASWTALRLNSASQPRIGYTDLQGRLAYAKKGASDWDFLTVSDTNVSVPCAANLAYNNATDKATIIYMVTVGALSQLVVKAER